VRLGVVTDPHIADEGAAPSFFNGPVRRGQADELLGAALDWLAPRVDALVLLGDLADAPAERHYHRLAEHLDSFGPPVFAILGNHDLPPGQGSPPALSALGGAVRFLGREPLGRHRLTSSPLRREGEGFVQVVPFGSDEWRGGPRDVGPSPAAGDLLIWAGHFPVVSLRPKIEACGWEHAGDLDNRDQVLGALTRQAGPILALTGHLHVRAHAISGNVLQLACASLAEAPHDAAVIEIAERGGALTVTRHCRSFAQIAPCDQVEDIAHHRGHDALEAAGAVLDRQHSAFAWLRRRWREVRPQSTGEDGGLVAFGLAGAAARKPQGGSGNRIGAALSWS
jgi:hypothetical protein